MASTPATAATPVAEESARQSLSETELRGLTRPHSAYDAGRSEKKKATAAREEPPPPPPPPPPVASPLPASRPPRASTGTVLVDESARQALSETELRSLARPSADDAGRSDKKKVTAAREEPPPTPPEATPLPASRPPRAVFVAPTVRARLPRVPTGTADSSGEIVGAVSGTALVEESARQALSETELRGLARPTAVDAGRSDKEPPPVASPLPASSIPPRAVVAAAPARRLPRTFLGFTLLAVSNTYVPLATGVFIAVNITFMGFAYVPPQSVLALASPCAITRADVHELYTVLAVGLVFSVCQVLASALAKGALEAQEDARKQLLHQEQAPAPAPPPPRCYWRGQVVHCRVMVAVAAACLAVSMVCSIQGLLLAVSVRLGKYACWTGATRGFLGAGAAIASLLAAYCVAAGLGAAFYAD